VTLSSSYVAGTAVSRLLVSCFHSGEEAVW